MNQLGIAWDIIKCCSWSSLILMLAATGVFGQYMLEKYNHRPRTLDDKTTFVIEGRLWLSLKVFCFGLGLQALAIFLANVIPGHH